MLEISQALLVATTALITLALGAYVVAVFAAGLQKKTVARQTVLVGGAGQHDQDVAPGAATPAKSAPATGRGLTWFGSKFVQLALLSLTGSMIVRMFATGHPPFANHYEFAVSFAWGMILAQVYFEWRYRVRTLALVDWQLLLLFLGLFVVNREVEAAGFLADCNRGLAAAGVDLSRPGWLFSVTAVLSNIVSNVPAVMLLLPGHSSQAQETLLAVSNTLAGNLLLPGSIANLIVAEQTARFGVRLGPLTHALVGIPATVAALAFAAWWLIR